MNESRNLSIIPKTRGYLNNKYIERTGRVPVKRYIEQNIDRT